MNYPNRPSQSFNILSHKPANTQPIIRQTKAQKYFQQSAVLPKTLKDDMMLSMNNPEIDGRPSKPVSVEVETPDENDPFYQISRVTNKIGHLVSNYEEQAEQEHYLMLQELDSNFQINNYDTKEILDESRKAVDGLMNKAKVLKETQAGMLDDLSDWFSREEKSLKDADLTSNISLDTSIPVTTDDLLQVLQSSAGTSQQRITKAISLHGDIVSHAFFAIHELQRKIKDQENLISDLQHQLSEISSRKIQRQQSQLRPGSNESRHRLQEALSRITTQDEIIKSLKERIEQLVGESVLQSRPENMTEKDESLLFLKMHDAIANEMKLNKQETEINSLTDEIFKLKHDLQTIQSDKTFLESQVLSYQEKIDLERTRYESLQKQYLDLVNEQQDLKELGGSEEEKKQKSKEKSLLSRIVDLQEEIQKLNDQIIKERKESFRDYEDRIKSIRKEFETREFELNKRRINESLDLDQQRYFEAIQSQHVDEIDSMKKNCEETIEALKKKLQEEKDSLEKEFINKIKSFQKQIRNDPANNTDVVKLIDMMQKRSEEKITEIKKSFTEKIDIQRDEFKKNINALEEEIKNKDIQLISLKSEIDDLKSASKALNSSKENESIQNENQIFVLNNKIKEISDSFESDKQSAIEEVKAEFIEKLNKASEIEKVNKKLLIEIDVLKNQLNKGNDDSSMADLMNNYVQQSAELNETKEELEELKKKLSDSEGKLFELTKENLKLKNDKDSKKFKLLDYVYSELFSLSKPAKSKSKNQIVYEVDNQQHFLMKYEIAASIEPRLQEHIKKLKNKPLSIDNNSPFIKESFNSFYCQFSDVLCLIDLPLKDVKIEGEIDSRIKSEKVVSKTVEVVDILKDENVHQAESIIKHSSLSFSFLSHLSIAPSLNDKNDLIKTEKETSQMNQIPSIQLGFQMNETLFIDSNVNSFNSLMNVAVQVQLEKRIEMQQKAVLSHQPPLEIFAVTESIIRPDDPIVLDPSGDLLGGLDINKKNDENEEEDKKNVKLLLLTKTGEFIDIPAINEVDSSTNIDAAYAVSKMVMQETTEISNKLKLVVSEIQAIDKEPDPSKRAQMQETLGVQLDVEKDSLISQMRERITELEQMMNRVVENQEEAETQIEIEIEKEIQTDTKNDDVSIGGLVGSEVNLKSESPKPANVALMSNSTQTDHVELESVGVTPTDFSMPEDLEQKRAKKMEMSQTLTIASQPEKEEIASQPEKEEIASQPEKEEIASQPKKEEIASQPKKEEIASQPEKEEIASQPKKEEIASLKDVTASSAQNREIECQKTVDLSTEFGVQYISISPYSQRSQAEDKSGKPAMINLQISGKIEGDYGYKRLFTQTATNEQFSLSPKVGESPADKEPEIERKGSSLSLEKKAYADVGVCSEANNGAFPKDSKKMIIRKTHTIDTINVNFLPTKVNTYRLVTRNILNVKPGSLKGDIRIAQIQQQAEQISVLKKQILQLQFASPDSMGSVLSSVSSTMTRINEGIKAMQTTSGGVIIKRRGSSKILDTSMAKLTSDSTSTALLRDAIETSSEIAVNVFKDQNHLMSTQNDIFMRINEASNQFLRDMQKQPDGATTECQSKFLRQVNEISVDFSDTISFLRATISKDESMKSSLNKAIEQLDKQEKFVESLQKQILDLKLGTGKSHLVQQLADIKDELSNVINRKSDSNSLFKSFEEAQKIIPMVALRGRNDNVVRQAGASLALERVAYLSQRPETDSKSGAVNKEIDWNAVLQLLSEAVVLLDEHDAKLKARKIIDELNCDIKKLQNEVTKLQTDLIIAGRDLQVADDKYNAHVKSLQRSLDTSNEHSSMLERQIEAMKSMMKCNDKEESRIRSLENELEFVRHSDRKKLDELAEANQKNSELIRENKRLSEELAKSREMYSSLFNQCTDTQTTNDSLKSKTEEVFKEAQIAKQKVAALEKMRQSASHQADDLAHQLSTVVSENAQLQNMLIKAKQKQFELENQLLNNKPTNPADNDFSDQVLNASHSNANPIKAYQQRIGDYMNIIVKNGNDLVDLRARHAADQRSIIMMQREMKRNQSDQKISQIKYDCAKKENGLLVKAIANRDETIRLLKREIERLRSLLKVQGPLKQKVQLFEREKNMAESDFLNAQNKLNNTKIQRDDYAKKNPNSSTSYFDDVLQRQQATLARLERRRNELREIEEKRRIETLKAVAQVVNMDELRIPEEVVLNLMPKPSPVQRLQQRNQLIEIQKKKNKIELVNIQRDVFDNNFQKSTEFETLNSYSSSLQNNNDNGITAKSYSKKLNDKSQTKYFTQPSYADTLHMIGQLVGQKSPRTLHEMLRNSRQSRIVMPVQPAPYMKKNDTKSILTIKPMRK